MVWTKFIQFAGLLLIPVLFVSTLMLMFTSLRPDEWAELQPELRWQIPTVIAVLVAYALFAATWRRSIISKIGTVFLQIVMLIFLVLAWFSRF